VKVHQSTALCRRRDRASMSTRSGPLTPYTNEERGLIFLALALHVKIPMLTGRGARHIGRPHRATPEQIANLALSGSCWATPGGSSGLRVLLVDPGLDLGDVPSSKS